MRVLRGERMRSDQEGFDELAAALQFPAYFGGNWNAVTDCLRDLQWLPGAGYLVVITNAGQLFSDTDVRAVASFVTSLKAAAGWWRQPQAGPMAHAPTPFSVVAHVSGDARNVKRRFESAGARFH